MSFFETQYVINKDTYTELKKYVRDPNHKLILILGWLLWFMLFAISIFTKNYLFVIFGSFAIISMTFSYWQAFRKLVKINLERAKENTGTTELNVITSFTDDKINIYTVNTGNTTKLNYDAIIRFAETKNMYALFSKGNQLVVINKASIIQEQKTDDFVRFIKNKCKNIQWQQSR